VTLRKSDTDQEGKSRLLGIPTARVPSGGTLRQRIRLGSAWNLNDLVATLRPIDSAVNYAYARTPEHPLAR
jgi:hypothetical protein